MGLEIEAKMKVDDLDEVRQRLETAGAIPAGEHLETNVFFDTPARALVHADKGLRIRANRDVKSNRTEHIVTFKGARQPGPLKTRQEIEFIVSDPAAAAQVFQELGYALIISFQKHRRSWLLLGCKVELDELPHLGTFVEIEGPNDRKVLHARKALGLEDQPIVTTSYAALLANYLDEHKISSRIVEFPSR